MPKPTETVPIVLKYNGPDVDDGSMSIEDIVPVLQGFSSAYTKIAAEQGIGIQHRIRITGVSQSSANILLEVWDGLRQAADPLTSLSILAGAATAIVATIVGVIELRRHIKNQPYREHISGNNTISIVNSKNVTIEMPIQVFNVYKNKLIDGDLGKIVRPLQKGKIDSAEILAVTPSGNTVSTKVTADEQKYFDNSEQIITSTKETWLVGQLNSLTKTTNSGHVFLSDGSRVFYKWVGENPKRLHAVFAHAGPVRMRVVAFMDASLRVEKLEMSEIEPMQGQLFPVDASVDGETGDEDE